MPLNTSQAVDRYRTLGLAIEAAVVMDHWNEVETLIAERDTLLDSFSSGSTELSVQAKQQMKACDHRLLQFLMNSKSQTANEVRQVRSGSNARRAYQTPSGQASALDRAG